MKEIFINKIKLVSISILFILSYITGTASPVLAADPDIPDVGDAPDKAETSRSLAPTGFHEEGFMKSNKIEFYATCGASGATIKSSGGDDSDSDSSKPSKEQKIAKTILIGVDQSESPDDILSLIDKYKIGGLYTVSGTTAEEKFNKDFFDKAADKSLGTFIASSDEESSDVHRYTLPDTVPTAQEIGNLDEGAAKGAGEKIAGVLNKNGVTLNLAPIVDIYDPSTGLNHLDGGKRSFGQDADTVSKAAMAFTEGLESGGVKPVFKHFPGLGAASGNTDQQAVHIPYDANAIKPFKDLIDKFSDGAVMTTNAYVDGVGNAPGSINPDLVDKLKNDVGFNGVVMSDDLGALTKYTGKSLPDIVADSYNAGVDVHLINKTYLDKSSMDDIINAVKDKVSDDKINDAYDKAMSLAKSGTPKTVDPECCSDSGNSPTHLVGDINPAKAFNFFVSKGLTPEQSAGIVGNLMHESGVLPQRLQGTPADVETPPDQAHGSSAGWGIAQWTPAAKVIDAIRSKGQDPAKLADQLDYLWWNIGPDAAGEFPADSKTLAAVKQTSTAEEAATAFMMKFERPGNPALGNRVKFANQILSGDVDGATSSGDSGESETANCGDEGAGASDSFVYYKQADPKWAKHPFPPAGPMDEAGCGPTSLAMIIATKVDKSVTPPEIADWVSQNGLNTSGGISHAAFGKVAEKYGLQSTPIGHDIDRAEQELRAGNLLIANGAGSAPFTSGGHIIVARGMTDDGKFIIANPYLSGTAHDTYTEAEMISAGVDSFWVIK